jgi:ABC-type lipoprotein export system ATPase subunit
MGNSSLRRREQPKDPSLVIASHVYKTYDMGRQKVRALSDVSLTIQKGECVAILGPSGCGKTTLLNLLGGLDLPSQGEVLFESRSLASMRDSELSGLRRRRIGFVFQFYNLIPNRTALDNVALPLFFAGRREADSREAALRAMEAVGVAHRSDHFPAELSGGEQQRVAIARALVIEPSLILADEPTGNLDSATGRLIVDMLVEQRSRGIAVVVATHDLHLAAKADRKVEMLDGTIAQVEGTG